MSPSSKSSPSSPSMNAPPAGSQENHEQAPQGHPRLHPTHKQCTLQPEEPLNGGSSKDFSPNFTPNRFQTGRLSRFGVKCRLFGGERGWRTHQHPPAPTSAHQRQPRQPRPNPRRTNQCTLKPEESVCCINSTNQNYGFGMLRRLDFAISTMWPTPPPKTVRVAAREKPISISIVMFGGIDKALGSVMMSISTGPS
ncbi:hypothetical protein FRC0411_02017 [Corynebacterium diphtheriae]|nr:hypothetical protein FRC0411_02017 [Corynebacterium diphtheriae]CAB0968230.1 hypothetical protein FRC0475_01936 [Corynebacterium diphtheriae]